MITIGLLVLTVTLLGVLVMAASNINDAIAELQAAVAADTSAEQSALTLINGIPGMIQAAVEAALDAGATPTQLAAFDTLTSTISANGNALAAAVTANTPTSPTPPPVVTPPVTTPPPSDTGSSTGAPTV